MCARFIALLVTLTAFSASTAEAKQHASWPAYMKKNRYKCPGPMDTLAKPRTMKLAGKSYKHTGAELTVQDPDSDSKVIIGVVSAIKDTSPGTKKNIEESIKWFQDRNVEWLVVNGDLALDEFDLEEVIDLLGQSGLPVLVVLGNSESKGSWARAYGEREGKYPNLVNGTWIRKIVADDVEFWTMPGYHDRTFVRQGAGCLYDEDNVNLMVKGFDSAGKGPVVLVAHGPPKGKGKKALDWIQDKKNVGDPGLNKILEKKSVPFGLFGHILEAGGAAVGKDFEKAVKPKTPVDHLYINAGSLSGDPWAMNSGSTSYGMATIFTIDGGKAQYETKRFKYRSEN